MEQCYDIKNIAVNSYFGNTMLNLYFILAIHNYKNKNRVISQ